MLLKYGNDGENWVAGFLSIGAKSRYLMNFRAFPAALRPGGHWFSITVAPNESVKLTPLGITRVFGGILAQ